MNTDVAKAILNAINCVSTDETRYQLNHVLIRAEDESVVVEAVDGHVLSQVRVVDEFATEMGDKRLVLHHDQAKVLKNIIKDYKFGIPHEWIERGIMLGSLSQGSAMLIFTDKEANIKFPDTKNLMPTRKPKFTIGLDPELLLRVAKALGHTKTPTKKIVTLEMVDELTAVRVTLDGQLGLVMPGRIGKRAVAEDEEPTPVEEPKPEVKSESRKLDEILKSLTIKQTT